ncbi:hypothetical protein CR513_00121, partial [Mucuna pruriens]
MVNVELDPRASIEQRPKPIKKFASKVLYQRPRSVDSNIKGKCRFVCMGTTKPVAYKKRRIGGERRIAMEQKTTKLKEARFIKEVNYTTWLSNVVLVKKKNNSK